MRFTEGALRPSPASRAGIINCRIIRTIQWARTAATRRPPTATAKRSALSADEVRAFADRAPRCTVALQVLCTIPGDGDGVGVPRSRAGQRQQLRDAARERHAVADRRGGRVRVQARRRPGGAVAGRAEVVRTVSEPPRMGLRFVDARRRRAHPRAAPDRSRATPRPRFRPRPGSRRRPSSSTTDRCACGSPPRRPASSRTTRCCTSASAAASCRRRTDVPLGTGYQMDILDGDDRLLVRCKAKVAAKQDRWIGLRFLDIERSALQALRAEIAKLGGQPARRASNGPFDAGRASRTRCPGRWRDGRARRGARGHHPAVAAAAPARPRRRSRAPAGAPAEPRPPARFRPGSWSGSSRGRGSASSARSAASRRRRRWRPRGWPPASIRRR